MIHGSASIQCEWYKVAARNQECCASQGVESDSHPLDTFVT